MKVPVRRGRAIQSRWQGGRRLRPDRGQAGFTVVEGLIAALILAIVLIGILPMVTMAMQNNLIGNDSTNESNAATDGVEKYLGVPFNDSSLLLAAGSTALVSTDYFLLDKDKWVDQASYSPADEKQYTRSATVEWFSAGDLYDDGKLNNPRDGSTKWEEVQIKRVSMEIERERMLGNVTYKVVAYKAQ